MKIRFGKFCFTTKELFFFLFMCSVFDKLKISIPFFVICIFLFIKDVFKNPKKCKNSSIKWYSYVILMFLLGILWTSSRTSFSNYILFDFIRMAECIFIMVWLSYSIENEKDVQRYLGLFAMVMGVLFLKLVLNTPFDYWGTERLGETVDLKPTMLGLSMAFGGTATFYLYQERKRFFYMLLTILFLIISLLTGSRMGVLIMALGISCFFALSARGTKFIRNCLIIVFSLLMGYYLIMNVNSLYTTIGVRFENFLSSNNEEQSVKERTILKKTAMNLFKKSPIYGSGTEAFRAYSARIGLQHVTYSHCNYTEMLANYGIVGFIIYYYFLFKLLFYLFRRCKKSKIDCIMFVFLFMILVSDYGYISYYGLFQQYFISLIYAYVSLKQKNQ